MHTPQARIRYANWQFGKTTMMTIIPLFFAPPPQNTVFVTIEHPYLKKIDKETRLYEDFF